MHDRMVAWLPEVGPGRLLRGNGAFPRTDNPYPRLYSACLGSNIRERKIELAVMQPATSTIDQIIKLRLDGSESCLLPSNLVTDIKACYVARGLPGC